MWLFTKQFDNMSICGEETWKGLPFDAMTFLDIGFDYVYSFRTEFPTLYQAANTIKRVFGYPNKKLFLLYHLARAVVFLAWREQL